MSDTGSVSFSVPSPPPREEPAEPSAQLPVANGVEQAKEILLQDGPNEPAAAAAPVAVGEEAQGDRGSTPPPVLAEDEKVPSPPANAAGNGEDDAANVVVKEASDMPVEAAIGGGGSPAAEGNVDEAPVAIDAEAPAAPEAAQGEDNGAKRKAENDDADEPEAKKANIAGAEEE